MLASQHARRKIHSTLVEIQKRARNLNFCRRVDMEKFATKFSLAHSCDRKIGLENHRALPFKGKSLLMPAVAPLLNRPGEVARVIELPGARSCVGVSCPTQDACCNRRRRASKLTTRNALPGSRTEARHEIPDRIDRGAADPAAAAFLVRHERALPGGDVGSADTGRSSAGWRGTGGADQAGGSQPRRIEFRDVGAGERCKHLSE